MDFLKDALELKEEAITFRRDFHRYPEASHKEIRTNLRIREILDASGISYDEPKENITIASVQGKRPGAVIGIRCDTDALQLKEETGLIFRSEIEGIMHACGHDAHIAIGLCAAKILHSRKNELAGLHKIIFQPAEEGERGANEVIATGLISDINAFFAVHVWSMYKSGTLHISEGCITAATDMFTIRIQGKGGHAATPHLCVDTVTAGSAIVTSLQQIASRFISPLESVVVTVGSFHAGTRCNIIAGEAALEGTLRSFGNDTRKEVIRHFERLVTDTASAYGCESVIDIRPVCGTVINDCRLADIAKKCAGRIVSPDMIGGEQPSMLGDDFASYSEIAPCCYAQVGIANEDKGTCYSHHHSRFDIDEEVLPICIAWACEFAADAAETLIGTT